MTLLPLSHGYITSLGAFLPGDPIPNDEMEEVLGRVDGTSSRLRERVLRSNGIQTRHYALDRNQKTTHQNSELAALAAQSCLERAWGDPKEVDLLAVGTTQGDLPLPGMASMVQAELGLPPCEILTAHGVCSAGMQALKAAWNQVRLGDKKRALVCASELSSRLLKKSRYEAARSGSGGKDRDLEAEFLRWMLSDGAAAMLLEPLPRPQGISLRVDWIEIVSYAADYDLCMSCGRAAPGNGHHSWQDYPTYGEAEREGALLLRQDLKLLENIVKVGVEGFLSLVRKGWIRPDEIDYFLCHYSSHHFRGKIFDLLRRSGCMVPEERWFTNLYSRGNTGCASPFLMLEELFWSGRLQPGQTIFLVVPESGRFVTAYARLTVCPGDRA